MNATNLSFYIFVTVLCCIVRSNNVTNDKIQRLLDTFEEKDRKVRQDDDDDEVKIDKEKADKEFREQRSIRHGIQADLFCQQMGCDKAEINIVLSVQAFYHLKTMKKTIVISTAADPSYPGTGWSLALVPKETNEGNRHKLGPIFFSITHEVYFNKQQKVSAISYTPKSDVEDTKDTQVRMETNYITGKSLKIGISLSGGGSFQKQPGKGKKDERVPGGYNVGGGFGFNFEYVPNIDERSISSTYSANIKEYDLITGGKSDGAFVSYSRANQDHGNYAQCGPAGTRWNTEHISAISASGMNPGFSITIAADNDYGKKQVVTFKASAVVAELMYDGGCDGISYQGENLMPIEFETTITIYWNHPIFTLYDPFIIKCTNYRHPEHPTWLCLEAKLSPPLGKVVYLADCDIMARDSSKTGWLSDGQGRIHWFTKELVDDHCLSTLPDLTKNIIIEPCGTKRNQIWTLEDGILSNVNGKVTIVPERRMPTIEKDYFGGDSTWIIIESNITVGDAFEFKDNFDNKAHD